MVPTSVRTVTLRGPSPLAGDDVDDAADGVGAVEAAHGPADHLDALDVLGRQVGEIELAVGDVVGLDAVDQHQRVVALGAADAHLGEIADAAAAADGDARQAAQGIDGSAHLLCAQLVARHHRYRIADGVGGSAADGVAGCRRRRAGRALAARSEPGRRQMSAAAAPRAWRPAPRCPAARSAAGQVLAATGAAGQSSPRTRAEYDFVDDERMTPLQQLERSIASGISLEADEHADCLRRTRRHRSGHRRWCSLPPGGHDRHDLSLEHEPSPLRVSVQPRAPRR